MPPKKLAATCGLVLLLVGCSLPAGRQGEAPTAQAAGGYRIDTAGSELRVLVFRAGPMARLGHDHVIVNRELAGWVDPAGGSSAASFRFEIPAAAFAVDDWDARSTEGPDFAEPISEDAKRGTRHNMLGDALLDADSHPAIIVRSVRIEGSEPALVATVSITVAGHESKQLVPFSLARSTTLLVASADFRLRQSSLGLTPFSVMMGALQVQDEIRVKLRLVVVPQSGAAESGGLGKGRDDDRSPLRSDQ